MAYDYAFIQVVPRVQHGDRMDVGVVLQSRGADYLGIALAYDPARIARVFPALDLEMLQLALSAVERVAKGGEAGGSIGRLPASERFHWLTAPRSAVVQSSAVHEGWTRDPEGALAELVGGLALGAASD
jgi:hypothetical protein